MTKVQQSQKSYTGTALKSSDLGVCEGSGLMDGCFLTWGSSSTLTPPQAATALQPLMQAFVPSCHGSLSKP